MLSAASAALTQIHAYQLCSVPHATAWQAAVIGVSCRHDVMELLEKRVRSRFSHRKHLIPDLQEQDLDTPGNNPSDILSSMLTIPGNMPTQASQRQPSAQSSTAQKWTAAVADVLSNATVQEQLKLMLNQGGP